MRRWFDGTLTTGDLQLFAGEHYHALLALERAARHGAVLADGLLAEQLVRYADEQEEAVELWCEFAVATGWGGSGWYFGEDPLPQTVDCARVLSGAGDRRPLVVHLATICAFESAMAELAPQQLDATGSITPPRATTSSQRIALPTRRSSPRVRSPTSYR
jgi:pyrroloquinoline quinone (PQQ) biosynthesis protein C